MTSLRGILKKKEQVQDFDHSDAETQLSFAIRSISNEKEVVAQTQDNIPDSYKTRNHSRAGGNKPRNFSTPHFGYRESANASITGDPTARRSYDGASEKPIHPGLQVADQQQQQPSPKSEKRSSFFPRRRSRSDVSANIPDNIGEAPPVPTISISGVSGLDEDNQQREARWEKRATMLAANSNLLDSASQRSVSRERSPSISDESGDVNIQEAIRLHEEGDLSNSTRMFGRLADPNGANNALSQVLYGLALRHGWGIEVDTQRGIHYLSLAAANSANIEQQALASGMKKGGAAKGELVLAIFELANCFRNGWGVNKDAAAARHYYETAANLGDTDAMEEAAWCYQEGFGGPKDKYKAAQYLRLAEKTAGKAIVGNSWIWKDKYNPK